MAALQLFETAGVTLLVLVTTVAFRRLYLHPLAHIPGPKLAALTWWYEFYYDGIKPGQYVFRIQEMHQRYGECQIGAPKSCCLSTPERLWSKASH